MNTTKPEVGKRLNFIFHPDSEALLRKIAKETDLKMTAIIKQGIELVAKQKGVAL